MFKAWRQGRASRGNSNSTTTSNKNLNSHNKAINSNNNAVMNVNVVQFSDCIIAGGPVQQSILTSRPTSTNFDEIRLESSTPIPRKNVRFESISEESLERVEQSIDRPQSRQSQATSNASVFSGAEFPVPKKIEIDKLKKHMPKDLDKHIQIYMSTRLFESTRVIPLWSPSPGIESNPQEWKHHIDIGDVGFFNDEGGFDTLFNIFLTMEENHDLHFTPPEDFVCYGQKSSVFKIEDTSLLPTTMIKGSGLEGLSSPLQYADLIGNTRYVDATQCAVIYLPSKYRSLTIKSAKRPAILTYIQQHQEAWQLHVENNYPGQFRGRPLLVIGTSLRTKAYALAAGYRPNFLGSWKPTLTLQKLVEGDHISDVWETMEKNIQTKFSPSKAFQEKLEMYIKDMGSKLSADERHELEECHCVGVGAFGLRQKKWILGGSVVTGKTSKSTITPARQSKPRWSLPAFFSADALSEVVR